MKNAIRTFSGSVEATLISSSFACENRVVEINRLSGTLVVATAEPLSESLRNQLQFLFDCDVRGMVRSEEWISERLRELYGAPEDLEGESAKPEPILWYWIARRDNTEALGDQTLHIHMTGYSVIDGEDCHFTGGAEITKEDPDHEMWLWVMKYDYFEGLIESRELPRIRRMWKRYCARMAESCDQNARKT